MHYLFDLSENAPTVLYNDERSLEAICGLEPDTDKFPAKMAQYLAWIQNQPSLIAAEIDNRGPTPGPDIEGIFPFLGDSLEQVKHTRGLVGVEQQEEVVQQSTEQKLLDVFGLGKSGKNQNAEMLPEYYAYRAEGGNNEYRVPQEEQYEGYSDQNNKEDGGVVAAPVMHPNDLTAPEKRKPSRKRRARVFSLADEEPEMTEDGNEKVALGEKNDLPHKRRKTVADNQYTCPELDCGKSVPKKQMKAHKLWHSVGVPKEKKCKPCELGFERHSHLHNHLESKNHYKITGQSLEEKQKCICDYPDCKREFFNEVLLGCHKRTVHSSSVSVVASSENLGSNICEDCGYVGRKDNMANHKKIVDHSLQKLCPLCTDADQKIYKTHIALSQHIRSSHRDERVCKECGFEAESVQKLLAHLKKAQHTRKFICEDCFGDFLSLSMLTQHREKEHDLNKGCMVLKQKK